MPRDYGFRSSDDRSGLVIGAQRDWPHSVSAVFQSAQVRVADAVALRRHIGDDRLIGRQTLYRSRIRFFAKDAFTEHERGSGPRAREWNYVSLRRTEIAPVAQPSSKNVAKLAQTEIGNRVRSIDDDRDPVLGDGKDRELDRIGAGIFAFPRRQLARRHCNIGYAMEQRGHPVSGPATFDDDIRLRIPRHEVFGTRGHGRMHGFRTHHLYGPDRRP